MDKFFSFLNKLFLIAALIGFIVAVLDKIFGFAVIGLYPLSYLRFTGTCLLFVVAISLYLMAGAKAVQCLYFGTEKQQSGLWMYCFPQISNLFKDATDCFK